MMRMTLTPKTRCFHMRTVGLFQISNLSKDISRSTKAIVTKPLRVINLMLALEVAFELRQNETSRLLLIVGPTIQKSTLSSQE